MIKEYIPDPVHYPKKMTISQMAQMDADLDDREMLFEECLSDEVKWQIISD
jgi:hypothetical protein